MTVAGWVFFFFFLIRQGLKMRLTLFADMYKLTKFSNVIGEPKEPHLSYYT